MTGKGVVEATPQYGEVPLPLKVVLAEDEDLLALAEQAERLTSTQESEH